MEITIPKKRSQVRWAENRKRAEKFMKDLENRKDKKCSFEEYCEFSLLFIDADDTDFESSRPANRPYMAFLTKPPLCLEEEEGKRNDETKKEEEQASKIVEVIKYAWSSIIGLIDGKSKNESNSLGIYTDENINLHFARLQEILLQLKGKNYRCALYIRENSYAREVSEKEMSEEIVFVKLLQNILRTQTKKIIDVRLNGGQRQAPNEQVREQFIQERQILKDIREVVKVREYFNSKYARNNPEAVTAKDPIDRLNEKRRFNAAAVRFHLQGADRR